MYILIPIAILSLVNIYVTYRVLRYEQLENIQKILQTLIIWFLPIFGAIVIFNFIHTESKPIPKTDFSLLGINERDSGIASSCGGAGD